PGVVGERARVDDDRPAPGPGRLDGGDHLALVAGLEVLEVEPQLAGGTPRGLDVHVEGRVPVDLGPTLSQGAEVGAVEQQDEPAPATLGHGHARPAISSRAAAAASGSTPVTTSTPPGPSSTKVRPSTAFLSRAINASSSSTSTPSGSVVRNPYSWATR